MGKRLLVAAMVTVVGVTAAWSALPIHSVGSGAQMGFNAVNVGYGAAAFGFGGHADIGLDLPIPLTLRYVPGIEMWVSGGEEHNLEWHDREINFNLFDARYYPPLPDRLPIKPYAGIGFPLSIYWYSYEYQELYVTPTWETATRVKTADESDFGIGASVIGGTEFKVSDKLVPFAEMKLKLGSPLVFKLTGGLTFRFIERAATRTEDIGTGTLDMPGEGSSDEGMMDEGESTDEESTDFYDALEP